MEKKLKRRGLVLAGGTGSRLFPLTKVSSKQLLPLYKKPVIAYPLQTLKDLGYVDVMIICGDAHQQALFYKLLGSGSKFGMKLSYIIQDKPRGLSDAFIVGEKFIQDADEVCMILGDNVIITEKPIENPGGNTIFTYKVKDPSAYGVAVLSPITNTLIDIVEKPETFISDNAVIGLYIFNNSCIEVAKSLHPSKRGELEIVDLIRALHESEGVNIEELDGFWLDIGDFDSLLDCGNLIRTITNRTNREIGLKNL